MSNDLKSLIELNEDRLLEKADTCFFGLGHSVDAVVWSASAEGRLDYINSYFNLVIGPRKSKGTESGWLGTLAWRWPDLIHPEDYARFAVVIETAMKAKESFDIPVRLLTRQGAYVAFMIRGAWVPRRDQSLYRWVGTAYRLDRIDPELVTEEERESYILGMTEEQRNRLSEPSSHGLREKEMSRRMARRLEFLAEASAELSSSLDVHTVLQNLAKLAVPRMADWIGVMELLPGQVLVNLAHFHRNPGKFHWGMTSAIKYPPKQMATIGSYRILRTGKGHIISYEDGSSLQMLARTPLLQTTFKEMGVRSTIVVPMRARGRILGTMSFTSSHVSRRMYDESDLEFGQEIANRLALAIDHANAYTEARRLNQAKDEFLATLSHEMRTPLNVIMGYSELLRAGWHSMSFNDIQTSLETVYRNSHAQLRIVDDLLNMSSMVLGNLKLNLSRFSISELVQQAVDNLLVVWKSKNIRIGLDFDRAPRVITADSGRVLQILLNLLTNAIKYTPVDGRIDVDVIESGENVEIVIRDTGIGIEPEYLPFVFDRFSQENGSTTRSYGGLGIGLAIVRNLVEMHGGVVKASSEGRNRGSKFVVTLPIGRGLQVGLDVDLPVSYSAASLEASDLKGIRVLLVEDDLDTRTLVRRYLERAGARVFEAESASEGFSFLESGQPHLILSDIGMPEEDGISFIKRVRSSEPESRRFTPAVALTAFTRPEDSERALAAGFQVFIPKPANKAKLISTLAELVQKYPVHGA